MADERARVEIGFEGGGLASIVATSAAADDLQQKLKKGEGGVLEIVGEDATYVVVLEKIVYLKRFARESQVGFGGTS